MAEKQHSRERFRVQALESDCLCLKSDSTSYSVTLQLLCFHFLNYKVREMVVPASQGQCEDIHTGIHLV